jgi:hypothetical protein
MYIVCMKDTGICTTGTAAARKSKQQQTTTAGVVRSRLLSGQGAVVHS